MIEKKNWASYHREYRKKNPEKIKQHIKKYRQTHQKYYKNYMHDYYEKNKEDSKKTKASLLEEFDQLRKDMRKFQKLIEKWENNKNDTELTGKIRLGLDGLSSSFTNIRSRIFYQHMIEVLKK